MNTLSGIFETYNNFLLDTEIANLGLFLAEVEGDSEEFVLPTKAYSTMRNSINKFFLHNVAESEHIILIFSFFVYSTEDSSILRGW